jgi:hypothetical protein
MIKSGHVACVGDIKMFAESVRKKEGKRPLGRPRCRWKNNIKMDHKHRV